MSDDVAERDAAMIRAGLWAFFAAARMTHPATPGQRGVTIAKPLAVQAAASADKLLAEFNARFPLDEMLAE